MNLKEFHCRECGKLLCKGILTDKNNILEVKCRNCKTVQIFKGPSAQLLIARSLLINNGLIPDPES